MTRSPPALKYTHRHSQPWGTLQDPGWVTALPNFREREREKLMENEKTRNLFWMQEQGKSLCAHHEITHLFLTQELCLNETLETLSKVFQTPCERVKLDRAKKNKEHKVRDNKASRRTWVYLLSRTLQKITTTCFTTIKNKRLEPTKRYSTLKTKKPQQAGARHPKQEELKSCSPWDHKHSILHKMRQHKGNTFQMKEWDKTSE